MTAFLLVIAMTFVTVQSLVDVLARGIRVNPLTGNTSKKRLNEYPAAFTAPVDIESDHGEKIPLQNDG